MKKDLEAKIYLKALGLVEEPLKQYSDELCDYSIAYVFDNYEEFKQYFIDNDCSRANDDKFLKNCIMKKTKKGTIITLKRLCDFVITRKKKETIINDEEVVTNDIEDKPKTKIK